MNRLKASLYAAAGIMLLALVIQIVSPRRVMAALGYTPVRDVDRAARQPLIVFMNNGSGGFGDTYTIPANKRLVIEYVSIGASSPGQLRSIGFQVWDAGLTGYIGTIPFPLTRMYSTDGSNYFSFAGATKIYVDPGTAGFAPGTALRFFSLTGDTFSGNLTFSGYLEPLH